MVCREDFEFLPPLRVFPPVSSREEPVSEVCALLVAAHWKKSAHHLTVEEVSQFFGCGRFTDLAA